MLSHWIYWSVHKWSKWNLKKYKKDTTVETNMSGQGTMDPTRPGFESNNHNADKMEGFCDPELHQICEL